MTRETIGLTAYRLIFDDYSVAEISAVALIQVLATCHSYKPRRIYVLEAIQSEAAKAFPLLIDEMHSFRDGTNPGFNPWDFSTSDRSTDDCIRFADGIECIMWRGGFWQIEADSEEG